jgi:16S rRNA (guanine527-N7)-methyltransferase
MTPHDLLVQGIAELGLDISQEKQRVLLNYLTLLDKWNHVYNLTAIRNPEQMVTNHLLDSLAVTPHLWPQKWLDVGCGAGHIIELLQQSSSR